ncbi:MAG: hypothetical protein IKH90_00185 [Ruminococcus sp.]|nr:hypothetical protein [Ruminococcus sp.]
MQTDDVDELFTTWLINRKNKVKKSTYANYKTMYDNYLHERFGSVHAEFLNSLMINQFINDMLSSGGKKRTWTICCDSAVNYYFASLDS